MEVFLFVISKRLLNTNTVQKKNPITGTMEAAESFKAHQSGIQYFAGSLSAKIANNMGINETKLIFSDRAIQHGRRWVKIRDNPEQVLPLSEVKNLPEMMSDPDEIHFDIRDRTYLFLKYYNGLNETGSKIEDSIVKGAFRKTGPSQAWQLISYLIVPHSTVTEPGVSIIYPKN